MERVDHPDHYNTPDDPFILVNGTRVSIECIDVIRNMPTWKGNVIKYLWRCGHKSEEGMTDEDKMLEDLEKARWYLQDKIDELNDIKSKGKPNKIGFN